MNKSNYVDFFRFNEKYEDVFIEDDHFLYACAEPFNWAHMMACNPYQETVNADNTIEWIREDTVGADCEYLGGLEQAPTAVAEKIIDMEHERIENLMLQLESYQNQVRDEINTFDVNASLDSEERGER